MFVSDAVVKNHLAALFRLSEKQLSADWDDVIRQANASAGNEILRRLMQRGYSAAQIERWDHAASFQLDMALFACVSQGGTFNLGRSLPTVLDRRRELEELSLSIAGSVVEPAGFAEIRFGELILPAGSD